MKLIGRLLDLRAKWKIEKMRERINKITSRVSYMLKKVNSVTEKSMKDPTWYKKLKSFDWRPKREINAGEAGLPREKRAADWQRSWVKWGWAQPAPKKAAAKENVVLNSCPGQPILAQANAGLRRVVKVLWSCLPFLVFTFFSSGNHANQGQFLQRRGLVYLLPRSSPV